MGNSPGTIDFIKGSAVRVSLLPNATKRCFGYFNCTEPTEISQSSKNNEEIFNCYVAIICCLPFNLAPEGGTPLLNFIPTKGSCEAEHSCTLPNGDVHGKLISNMCLDSYFVLVTFLDV